MEVRGGGGEEDDVQSMNSIPFHHSQLPQQPKSNQESSSNYKLSSSSPINISTLADNNRRRKETTGLGISSILNNNNHLQQQTPEKDPNPVPDPALLPPIVTSSPATNNQIQIQIQVRYKECLKNHAATMGRHAVDGCREFMPSGEEGSGDELKCAACDCHRNFHRREAEGEPPPPTPAPNHFSTYNINRNKIHPTQNQPPAIIPALTHRIPSSPQYQHHIYPHTHHHHHRPISQVMLGFAGNSGATAPAEYSSSEDLNMFRAGSGVAAGLSSGSKKRFRTKFTGDQKEKMQEFAEKLGWKIQKQDEEQVQQFCGHVGVKRQVFKVWMHNNKQFMKKN